VHLALPTLRERPGDILPLARHFIEEYRQRLGYGPVRLDASAEQKLGEHGWPGNIRELENVIHHALLICQNGVLGAEHLHLSSLNIQRRSPDDEPPASATPQQALEAVLRDLFNEPNEQMFEQIEETVMRTAFEFCHRNQVQAAKLLGISRNVLRSRLIKSREISALK